MHICYKSFGHKASIAVHCTMWQHSNCYIFLWHTTSLPTRMVCRHKQANYLTSFISSNGDVRSNPWDFDASSVTRLHACPLLRKHLWQGPAAAHTEYAHAHNTVHSQRISSALVSSCFLLWSVSCAVYQGVLATGAEVACCQWRIVSCHDTLLTASTIGLHCAAELFGQKIEREWCSRKKQML